MEVDMEQLRVVALEVISNVIKEGKLEQFTYGTFRKKVAETMQLEPGTLDAPEYKSVVHKIAKDYISKVEEQQEEKDAEQVQETKAKDKKTAKPRKPRATAPKSEDTKAVSKKGKKAARSASMVPSSDEDTKTTSAQPKPKSGKVSVATAKRVESEPEASGDDLSVEPPAKRQKTRTPQRDVQQLATSTSFSGTALLAEEAAKERMKDGEKSESEMSVLVDEPPTRKRKKVEDEGPSRKGKEPKGRKRKEPAKELSKDEETIKRLKSLVVACGVRKVWSKEFKDLDKPSEQIRRLRQILSDLGMSGRMSMEQAKAIKEKREFEQELEDVKEFAQKMESTGLRRSQTSAADAKEILDDSDVDVAPRRRLTARQSIMAFLGDESE